MIIFSPIFELHIAYFFHVTNITLHYGNQMLDISFLQALHFTVVLLFFNLE